MYKYSSPEPLDQFQPNLTEGCMFFKILQNIVHISINNFIFKTFICKICCIDCRTKLPSIKSERSEGVCWKH